MSPIYIIIYYLPHNATHTTECAVTSVRCYQKSRLSQPVLVLLYLNTPLSY